MPFIAEYEDGYKEHFDVDIGTLRSGDHIALMIAFEKQKAGQLIATRSRPGLGKPAICSPTWLGRLD